MKDNQSKKYSIALNKQLIGTAIIDKHRVELNDDINEEIRQISFSTLVHKIGDKKIVSEGCWKFLERTIKFSTINNLSSKKKSLEVEEVKYSI